MISRGLGVSPSELLSEHDRPELKAKENDPQENLESSHPLYNEKHEKRELTLDIIGLLPKLSRSQLLLLKENLIHADSNTEAEVFDLSKQRLIEKFVSLLPLLNKNHVADYWSEFDRRLKLLSGDTKKVNKI